MLSWAFDVTERSDLLPDFLVERHQRQPTRDRDPHVGSAPPEGTREQRPPKWHVLRAARS